MNIIVGCIVIKDGKVLLVREARGSGRGKLSFPVGHLEENETIVEGALRETYEESGYVVEAKSILPVTEVCNNYGKYILIMFEADIISKDNVMVSDISEVMWMNIEDVFNLEEKEFRHSSVNKEILKKVVDNEGYSLNLLDNLKSITEVNVCA